MFSFLAGSENETLIIETDLNADEKAVIKAGRKECKEHPENFTSWAVVKGHSR